MATRLPLANLTPQAAFCGLLIGIALSHGAGCRHIQRRATIAEVEQARELSRQGTIQLQQGDWQAAEEQFREAVEISPMDERGHAHLAQSLRAQGKLQEAIDAQSQAVVLSGGHPREHVALGELLLEAGKLKDAEAQASLAISKNRSAVEGWNLRGSVLIAANDLENALSCLHRSQAIEPKQTWVLEQLAWIYERQQRPQRALATWYSLEELYAVDDVPPNVLYRQALALKRLERPNQAVERLQLAQQLDPESAEITFALAELQWQTGDLQNARMTIAAASQRWPNDPRTRRMAQSLDDATRHWR